MKHLSEVLADIAGGLVPVAKEGSEPLSVSALIVAKEIALAHGRIYGREDGATQYELRRIANEAIKQAAAHF